MYAVFRTGGKQYRASKGEKLQIEKLAAAEGENVEFADVLLVGEGRNIKIGNPVVAGSKVKAKVLSQGRTGKISVIKFRRRSTYKRMHNHRQHFTVVEITGITGGPGRKSAAADGAAEIPAEE